MKAIFTRDEASTVRAMGGWQNLDDAGVVFAVEPGNLDASPVQDAFALDAEGFPDRGVGDRLDEGER